MHNNNNFCFAFLVTLAFHSSRFPSL